MTAAALVVYAVLLLTVGAPALARAGWPDRAPRLAIFAWLALAGSGGDHRCPARPNEAQLAAVLAHERAHQAGRHHLLLSLAAVPAAAFPRVPAFRMARDEVARLSELAADDAAAARSPRLTMAEARSPCRRAARAPLRPAQVVFVMACCR